MPDQVETETRTYVKSESDGENGEHDPHYEPIVSLPLVTISTNEEEEVELCKIRARLYRFDTGQHEWKERGTGDIKLLHHSERGTVRVVMRRDKTLKLCANHFITEDIQLNPHIGSDRAFNWTTPGDFADETAKQEFLAIKFGNVENANLWKSKFVEALEIVKAKRIQDKSFDEVSSDDSNSDSGDSQIEQKSLDNTDEKSSAEEKDEVVLQLSGLKLENTPAATE
ncbi:ran-specific GTPase-activating protein-like [Arctopsyche grandis]|uniref:ran-specific GTPase-activating protein-like n=1 Tax=Arctopsyche grandis TaxID=121162 RepID=UPI00406D7090